MKTIKTNKKGTTQNDTISLREFARRLGIGEKSIRDGVRLGKLKKGVIYKNGRPRIIFDVAKKEAESFQLGNKVKAIEIIPDDITIMDVCLMGIRSDASYAESMRVLMNNKAKLAEIEVKQKEGELVRRDIVYDQLFEYGKMMKDKFQFIPDRLSDELAVITDRNKIHEILSKAIYEVLVILSDANSLDFQEKK